MTDSNPMPGPWNEGLETIEPMIEFYTREMGALADRLMAALSLLTDLEDAYGWDSQGAQARDTVHYSRLLVASVLRIVAAAQAETGDETGMGEAIQAWLDRMSQGAGGGTT